MAIPLGDVLVGVYVGVLAGAFPGLIAFGLAFGFKYVTDVSIPGFGVVVLAAALAGVSGGLMGVIDPGLTGSWTGITAILVILMISFWAHAQGDKLATETPRRLSARALRDTRLSADLVDRVDALGQVRIRPVGVVEDLEGYPPLPEATRQEIQEGSWRFPTHLPLRELESRLAERLADDHDLAEVEVHVDREGRARIAAAPEPGGLSRRVKPGTRAASIRTLLPTGLARGDHVTLALPKEDVTGPVVSAWSDANPAPPAPAPDPAPDPAAGEGDPEEDVEREERPPPPRPATRGGPGRVTLALAPDEAEAVLGQESAPAVVRSRGRRREYEAVGLLKEHGNRFRTVAVAAGSRLDGETLAGLRLRNAFGVAVLAVSRKGETIVAPRGGDEIRGGDELVVVGPPEALTRFQEAAR